MICSDVTSKFVEETKSGELLYQSIDWNNVVFEPENVEEEAGCEDPRVVYRHKVFPFYGTLFNISGWKILPSVHCSAREALYCQLIIGNHSNSIHQRILGKTRAPVSRIKYPIIID